MSLFLLCIIPLGTGIISHAKAGQIQNNMKAVGEACRQYYMNYGQWPSNLSDLKPIFLSVSVDTSTYHLNPQDHILTIASTSSSLTISKPYGFTSRLDFHNF